MTTNTEGKPRQGTAAGWNATCGFTLVELLMVIAVIAILAAIAAPSFNDWLAKGRVKSATEDIYGLILQAKSEGPIRDTDMTVDVDTDAWCVGFSDGACDCTDTTSCTVNVAGTNVTQIVDGSDYDNITITSDFAGTTFSRLRGDVNNSGDITVTSGDWALDIAISDAGRIRICNPNNNVMTGYESCN